MNKIVFFGGKGGVGKTTCSAAFSLHSANCNKKTLLVSTDPAHSISDIFERPIGKDIIKLNENLYGIEIDAEYESQKYIDSIRGNLKTVISPIIIEEINRQLDAASISPGTHESAIFDKMIEIINEKSNEYDQIVFDTAPTGHTIRLLSLPELLGEWITSLVSKRKKAVSLFEMAREGKAASEDEMNKDPILNILTRRKTSMEKARNILINEKELTFIYVLNAEKLPIEETKKAIAILEKYGIPVNSLIVNRILPESDDSFWNYKKELEGKYLSEIQQVFLGKNIVKLPLLQHDMRAFNLSDMANRFEGLI